MIPRQLSPGNDEGVYIRRHTMLCIHTHIPNALAYGCKKGTEKDFFLIILCCYIKFVVSGTCSKPTKRVALRTYLILKIFLNSLIS